MCQILRSPKSPPMPGTISFCNQGGSTRRGKLQTYSLKCASSASGRGTDGRIAGFQGKLRHRLVRRSTTLQQVLENWKRLPEAVKMSFLQRGRNPFGPRSASRSPSPRGRRDFSPFQRRGATAHTGRRVQAVEPGPKNLPACEEPDNPYRPISVLELRELEERPFRLPMSRTVGNYRSDPVCALSA